MQPGKGRIAVSRNLRGGSGLLAIAASLLIVAPATPVRADTILFVGNSFTFGARSPVFRPSQSSCATARSLLRYGVSKTG
jgi:hypothetical protein